MYDYRRLSPQAREEVLRYREQQGYPLHAPPHAYESERWFLITAATYGHRVHFGEAEDRLWLREELSGELNAGGIECSAWVVLPNHYHLLVRCDRLAQIAEPLRRVHGRTARALNRRA